jgi:prepilin-type N-terminal cleavage/methylation domain-containing protein
MSIIKHNTGYTLTELMITIAIIGILGVLIAGAFTTKKAGAATPSPIPTFLRNQSVQFIYSSGGNLTIFNVGKATWTNADEVCAELESFDANLKSVTLLPAKTTNEGTELVWNKDHTELTTLDGRNEADCN